MIKGILHAWVVESRENLHRLFAKLAQDADGYLLAFVSNLNRV